MKKFIVAFAFAISLSTFCALAAEKAPPRGKPIAPGGDRKPDGMAKEVSKPAAERKQEKPDREKEMALKISNFVQQMKDEGLRGQELAAAIHQHLRQLGIGEAHGNPGGDDRNRQNNDRGMGEFVQEMLDKGLRGEELAAAIHAELRKRGVGKGHGNPGGNDNERGKAPEDKGPPSHLKQATPPQGGQGEKRSGPPFVPLGHRR